MTTVLPAAPIAPSTLPAEPRPSLKAEGDDESFAQLLDQHSTQRSTREPAARLEAAAADDPEDLDPAIAQNDDEEEDNEAGDISLPAPQPQLQSRHTPVLLPLGEHLLFIPELLSHLNAGLAETDAAPSEGIAAEVAPISKAAVAEKTSISSAPRLAILSAMFPTPMAQLQTQWTPAPQAPSPQESRLRASGPQVPVPTTLGLQAKAPPSAAPQASEPQMPGPTTPGLQTKAPLAAAPQAPGPQSTIVTPERIAYFTDIAASGRMPAESASATKGEKQLLPPENLSGVQFATPRISERSTPTLVLPPEIVATTTTTLPTDGQNLPQAENSPQSSLGESPVALAAPRRTSELSAPIAPSPTAEVTASRAAPEATPKVSEQTRAQIPRGTPAAKRGEVMPNSTLQAAPTPHRASAAEVLERPVEARPEVRMASAPTTPTTFADAPGTALSNGQPTTRERGGRDFEKHRAPSDTQLEIDTTAPANGPATRPEFENLRPELTSGPNSPRDEATLSRTELTRVIDRTTDAVVRMRAAGTERLEVAVQLESGAKLTIQLRMANGEVTPFIRTNSEALRTALEQNWSQFSDRSAERNVRLTPPVFEAGQSASNMTDLSQQRHGRDTSHTDRQAETFHFNARRPQVAPTTASGPTRIAPVADGLNLYA